MLVMNLRLFGRARLPVSNIMRVAPAANAKGLSSRLHGIALIEQAGERHFPSKTDAFAWKVQSAPRRSLSSLDPTKAGSPTSINEEQARAVMDTTLTFIRIGLSGRKLDALQGETALNVQAKWQKMMEVRLTTELHVINAFGYESSEMGMMAYRQTMHQLMQTTRPADLLALQKIDQQIWAEMIRRSFAIETEPIAVGAARQVVATVTSRMQQDAFIEDVIRALHGLGPDASEVDKNQELQHHLLGVWLDVLPGLGYEGEDGYVRFQAALVEHSQDPQVMTLIQSALMSVTSRTGLGAI